MKMKTIIFYSFTCRKQAACVIRLSTFIKTYSMITTTTNVIEGQPIKQYLGIVSSESIIGANIFKDLFAGIRDIVGGRSGTYERVIDEARTNAMNELVQKAQALGANAVIGIDLDFETVGSGGSMLMVIATGTAVRI
ncbi:heavy metal-binding domain-containing protein [Aridibaculum aurantiacum]|uniref:heavy metal-binding domain-containing protein n=1 Tax=Aridibaculum aurantiacum TaxID=2810307 RepID=UPI003CC91EE1